MNNKLDDCFRLYFLLSRELSLKAFPDNGSRCLHYWILDLTGKVRSRKPPDTLAESAQEEMQKHPKWNKGKGWKNTLNNLRLFIQPLCYFNLLKPWLVVIFTPQILRVFCRLFFQLSKLTNSLLEMIFPRSFYLSSA